MEAKQRSVIVNEADNRKLEVYTQGDIDPTPTGIGMFACDPTTTMRIIKSDNLGRVNVNPWDLMALASSAEGLRQ